MKKIISNLIEKIKSFAHEGLFYIFGSSVIAQIVGLLSSVIVVRRLPKMDYGYYTSANNLYSYLAIFIGMGLTSAILQYCSEMVTEKQKYRIYRHSLITGSLSNVIITIMILLLD